MDKNTKPNAGQIVGSNIAAEMRRQKINRTQMAKILGWPISRVSSRLAGVAITVADTAEISAALGVDWPTMYAGWNGKTQNV